MPYESFLPTGVLTKDRLGVELSENLFSDLNLVKPDFGRSNTELLYFLSSTEPELIIFEDLPVFGRRQNSALEETFSIVLSIRFY